MNRSKAARRYELLPMITSGAPTSRHYLPIVLVYVSSAQAGSLKLGCLSIHSSRSRRSDLKG